MLFIDVLHHLQSLIHNSGKKQKTALSVTFSPFFVCLVLVEIFVLILSGDRISYYLDTVEPRYKEVRYNKTLL